MIGPWTPRSTLRVLPHLLRFEEGPGRSDAGFFGVPTSPTLGGDRRGRGDPSSIRPGPGVTIPTTLGRDAGFVRRLRLCGREVFPETPGSTLTGVVPSWSGNVPPPPRLDSGCHEVSLGPVSQSSRHDRLTQPVLTETGSESQGSQATLLQSERSGEFPFRSVGLSGEDLSQDRSTSTTVTASTTTDSTPSPTVRLEVGPGGVGQW